MIMDFEDVEILEIAVKVGCPGNCLRFCPLEIMTEKYGDRPKIMTLQSFKQIISTLPKSVYIDFAGLTEPFVNPEFMDMAHYAHEQGYQFGVKTTLLGASAKDIEELASLNPAPVFIHMPDFIDFNPKITPEYVEAWFACLRYLRNAQYMTMNDNFETNSREVTARGQAKKHNSLGQCYRRDHPQMLVFPDGSTVICCIDVRMEHVVGNLLTQSYSELRKKFYSQHTYAICAYCSYNVSIPRFYLRKFLRRPFGRLRYLTRLWKPDV